MLKNILSFIFIYIFIIGCEVDHPLASENPYECFNCVVEFSSEDMEMDEDGYYHLDFIDDSDQTFAKIDAYVGSSYEYVGWISPNQYCFEWNGTTQCTNIINSSSYSGSDGIASTMLGVHEQHIGSTIKIYCGYYNSGVQYMDSLEVIVNE